MDSNKVQDMVKQLIGNAKGDNDLALADRLSMDVHNADLQKQVADRLSAIMPTVPTDTPVDKPKAKATGKAKPKAKVQGQQTADMQTAFIAWYTTSFKGIGSPVPRGNGTVYNGLVNGVAKKVVKTACFENKGGLFFGAVLNARLVKVKGAVHHPKSNVFKVPSTCKAATIQAIKKAIIATVDGYTGQPIK